MNSSATRSPTAAIFAREKRPRSWPRSEFMSATLLRPRLPAAVHPEPMVGIRPDLVLHCPGELLGQVLDRSMAGEGAGERAAQSDQVRAVGLAYGKEGQQRRAAPQREHRRRRRGAGLLTEEVHEDPPVLAHVLVDDDAEDLTPAQGRQGALGRAALRE